MSTLLKRGIESLAVCELRKLLDKHGYNVFPFDDKWFDLKVEASVRGFQKLHDLSVDGLVGPRTLEALRTIVGPTTGVRIEPVKSYAGMVYFPQRDNQWSPSGTCNVTSLAMVLNYRGAKRNHPEMQFEDELFKRLQEPDAIAYYEKNFNWAIKQGYSPRHVHGMLQWLVKQYGLTDALGFDKLSVIRDLVDAGNPQIVTGKFTASGHIIVLIGTTCSGEFIVHDPWGNWEFGYKNTDGKAVIYNFNDMVEILKRDTQGLYLHHNIP